MTKRKTLVALVAALFAAGLVVSQAAGADSHGNGQGNENGNGHGNGKVNHLVFIYEENHSFDNLYGTWGPVNGEAVNGLPQADLAHTVQASQGGAPYTCLLQNDVNLTTAAPTSPPLSVQCIDPIAAVGQSHFINLPWNIDSYIPASATTCPPPNVFAAHGVVNGQGLPGGCTEDLVHRFYQEQYQIDGGKQDRYVTGSDAVGLTMGSYDSTKLPIYTYLHSAGAPSYVIADNFFQGGFGGSFLNHQVLVAAQAPVFANADRSGMQTGCAVGTTNCDLHSVVDTNGFPNTYPLYTPTGAVKDQQLTEAAGANGSCTPTFATGAVAAPAGTLCGDYAINTIQPFTQPYAPGTVLGKRLPLLTSPNIGDAMSAKKVTWAWYSGGWDNAVGNNGRDAMHPLGPGWTNGPENTANGACLAPAGEFIAANAVFPNCPDALFQFHHQPFGYFANYADGTQGRLDHLKDEAQFLLDAQNGNLPAVSFVKPIGEENEHPGYASEVHGSDHLVDLIQTILNGPEGKDTMIVVTYDEFGGQWDHVSPPGTDDNPGPHDAFGPGTRIPALILGAGIRHSSVDHEQMDTTSILATIEHRFNVKPLRNGVTGQPTRDAYVNDLFGALNT
ncbi:MAG TPA: alkaline phosphatase family protein [Acidimicrobiales bacterium]|nr:alkaline phosphatase family protein [Acidimicrobiales bacterium]